MDVIDRISPEQPVLIAGPTASGKSALALHIAARQGGRIINADALQVFCNWRLLTARPSRAEEEQAEHALYGHVPGDRAYSVGDWLRDVGPLLATGPRPIIVGGTGLYFTALTEGLAPIPPVPADIRRRALDRLAAGEQAAMVAELDGESRARIDVANPRRVQRAWEVLQATGRGIAAWQRETPAPLLPLVACFPIVLEAPKSWLSDRIARRFDQMIAYGVLEEARRNLPGWDPAAPSSKAIGAAELIAHLQGRMTLDEAAEAAKLATRQYAKRQRSWFRARMADWHVLDPQTGFAP